MRSEPRSVCFGKARLHNTALVLRPGRKLTKSNSCAESAAEKHYSFEQCNNEIVFSHVIWSISYYENK
jgi:hypothetical protein